MFKPRKFDNSIIYHYLKLNDMRQYEKLDPALVKIIKQAAKATRGTRPGVHTRIYDVISKNRYITTKDVQNQVIRVMDDKPVSDRQAREIFKQCRIAAVNLKAYLWECMENHKITTEESDRILEKHLARMRSEMECTDFDDD